MENRRRRFFQFVLVLAFLTGNIMAQTNLYVAPNGDDSNDGATIGTALKTIAGAQSKVREIKTTTGLPTNGIKINFLAGTYPITSTVKLNSEDSGELGKPITYTAYNDDKVYFDGSKYLDPGLFTKVTDAPTMAKLHINSLGNVYVQTITDSELLTLFRATTTQMSMNDTMLSISRWPNKGFGHINGSTISGEEVIRGVGTPTNPVGKDFKTIEENFNFEKWKAEVKRIKKAAITGYVSADWYKETLRIHFVASSGRITLMDGSGYGLKNRGSSPNRFFVNHLLCEIDEPGEWYFDETDNKLYLWPISKIDANSKIGPWAGPMVFNIDGASYVNVEKVTIQHIGKGINGDGAINIRSGIENKVAGVTFRYIQNPVTSFNVYNAKKSGALSCNFFDAFGSRLSGGSRTSTSVVYGENFIENCHFTQIHSKDFYGGATGISGAGNIFRNNLIHNSNGQPITHSGVDHLIELNEIFNVGIEEGDGGAVYTGQDVSSFGNIIKHNFVHHIMSVPGLLGRASFFSDDYDAGEWVEENVIYKGGWEAIKMNKGGGHTVLFNVLLDCYIGVRNGDGGSSNYNSCMQYINSTNGKKPRDNIKANYIGRLLINVGTPGWETGLNETNWNTRIEPFWTSRYSYFSNLVNAYAGNNQMNAYECRIYDNMFWSNNINTYVGGTAGVLRSQAIDLTIFEEPDNLNFKFNTPRPAYAPDIPFENIGLYLDTFRCAIPNKDVYRRAIKQRFENLACHTGDPYNPLTINDRLYYNSGKAVMATIPCEKEYSKTEFLLDLGTTTSTILLGYERLSNTISIDTTFGWTDVTSLNATDRGTANGANDLNRDLIYSSQPKTFEAQVPNGSYNVVISFGDANAPHDNIIVKAEGVTKLSDIDIQKGEYISENFDVVVSDGKISIEFSDGGGSDINWIANGIEIKPSSSVVKVAAVTMSPETLSLNVGRAGILNAILSPSNASDRDVIWSSDNEAVATVDVNGVVTGISVGNATIIVTTVSGNNTATCEVTVADEGFGVTDLKLGKQADSDGAGHGDWYSNMVINETDIYTNTSGNQEDIQIKKFNFYAWQKANPVTPFLVQVNGDNNFTVLAVGTTRTSAEYVVGANSFDFKTGGAVVFLDDNVKMAVGFLDANADGSGAGIGAVIPYDITSAEEIWYSGDATTGSGSVSVGTAPKAGTSIYTHLKRNYHFNVDITAPKYYVTVNSVSVSPETLRLAAGESQSLTANVLPANATDTSVTWSSSDTITATVSTEGVVTAKVSGISTITATTTEGNKTATCELTVTGGISSGLNSTDAFEKAAVTLYPNPVETILNLKLFGAMKNASYIQIYNAAGAEIMSKNTSEIMRENSLQLDIGHLETGMYNLIIISKNLVMTEKFVKE